MRIRILGPVIVTRNDVPVPLPRSRKVRALFAFLALNSSPLSRSRLCDLLWDVPNDPRGELRWCLSRLRSVLDDPDRHRVVTSAPDLIALDLSDCHVDAIEVAEVVKMGIGEVTHDRLVELCDLFNGDLLDGMQIDGNPELTGWLAAQRHRYRAMHIAILNELAARAPRGSDETFRRLDAWLELAPFDQRAHEVMLDALVASGRVRAAEDHLAATIRSFEEEGLDWAPLRETWRAARSAMLSPANQILSSRCSANMENAFIATPIVDDHRPRGRVSVAIMPFTDSTLGKRGRVADGLTEDIITRLAKLRVLFVIARGTVYALGERGIGAQEAGRILNVEYVVSGSVRRHDSNGRTSVVVELAETEHAHIVWTDELDGNTPDDTFSVLDAIVNRVVATIAEEIETAECNRAILKPPSSLDAWDAYHRGLWHMYKFNGPDNREAEQLFRVALKRDPTFARAHAGLSFTHFQNAFLDLTSDRDQQMDLALESAGHSVAADDRDPAAHWAMGRALWLRGVESESLDELQRSVALAPSFALGHYTLGFVQSQSGDPQSAIDATNYSRQLSPFDPLQFGMLASRAVAHVRLGELEEAAECAVKAAARPNAHAHILAIAAECLALVNRRDDAKKVVARIRLRVPGYNIADFFRAFRFGDEAAKLFRHAARQIDFDS